MSIGLSRIATLATLISATFALSASPLSAEESASEKSPPATASSKKTVSPAASLSGVEVFDRMLPSTCWVRLEYMKGDQQWTSWGTGWVYDVGRHLIVTNEHVVHGHDEVTGFFPQAVNGEIQHDPDWYLKNGKKFKGLVIDRSTAVDLALIQLDGLPDNAAPLKLAEKSPLPGERIFAIASLPRGSEGLWIMTSGEVRQVYRRSHANGHFARVVETQLPINQGNSGGAVVNDRLDVVAVVEGLRTDAQVVSLFIDVNEVRDYLGVAVPLTEPATAQDFEVRGSRRFDEARYDQAIADYTAATKLEPKRASATMNRGWARFFKEDYETAIADFDAALKIDPELRGAYEGRGTCRREKGEYDEAIRDLTEAIRRDSSDADSYERRAKCYARLEKHENALKDRNRAVELVPNNPDYLLQRGQTYRAMKNFAAAQKDMEKAISLNPARAQDYYELAYVYFDQEAYPQAQMFFDMAAQRDNEAPEYIYMRGMSSFRMENYANAIPDLSKAVSMTRDRPHYYWNLALALWYLDRFAESAQAYSEYIRLKPDEPKGYSERADVYEAMGRNDLAKKDRGTAKRLKKEKD